MLDMPRSTQALLAALGHARPGPAVDIGSHEGAIARHHGCPYIHVDLTAVEAARRAGAAEVVHTDELPPGPFATAFFDAREYDPGLAAETVAQVAVRLRPDGVLITTARLADVEPLFAAVTSSGEALVAREPVAAGLPTEPWPTYNTQFQGQSYHFQSAPGVFSPRALDEGTLHMLEEIRPTPGARFLDLGCGVGVVSRIASEAWGCQVTATDVNARALRLTASNAPGVDVVASNGFTALHGREYDIIASNPPYHTDFGVAKSFIEGAHRHLVLGGSLYLVVKRADWYIQKTRSTFGGCRFVERSGYTIVIAEKRERKPAPADAEPPTTRKHARRQAEAAMRKRKRP